MIILILVIARWTDSANGGFALVTWFSRVIFLKIRTLARLFWVISQNLDIRLPPMRPGKIPMVRLYSNFLKGKY